MQNLTNHHNRTIPVLVALALVCLGFAPAAQAAGRPSIVGLWNVHYFVGSTEIFQSYDQWHSDGLEFEAAAAYLGAVCQGVFKQTANGTVQLHHLIWTFDSNGANSGHIDETQTNNVAHDGNTYTGTFDQKVYDLNGNLITEVTGTLNATRITVQG